MKKIVSTVLILMILVGCKEVRPMEKFDPSYINAVDDSEAKTFDFDLHSRGYLLIRLNDFKVLYEKNNSEKIYPASLTKIFTLDTVLAKCEDLQATSSLSNAQLASLIAQDASLANLKASKEYTLEELLYALVLPSGADAAVALENYFISRGWNLLDEMNARCKELGCACSQFKNTTGLHDDEHYTSIDDLLLVSLDCLKYKEGREILESLHYLGSDDLFYHSTVNYVSGYNVEVLGGKTGFTTVAGQLIMVFYKKDNRSYLLILSNSDGDSYNEQYYHYEDCLNIFRRLYD